MGTGVKVAVCKKLFTLRNDRLGCIIIHRCKIVHIFRPITQILVRNQLQIHAKFSMNPLRIPICVVIVRADNDNLRVQFITQQLIKLTSESRLMLEIVSVQPNSMLHLIIASHLLPHMTAKNEIRLETPPEPHPHTFT